MGGDRHSMPRKGIDNKPQKGLMIMKIVHVYDSSLNSPQCGSPPSPFNWIQWMNSCDKPWVGKLFCDALYSVD